MVIAGEQYASRLVVPGTQRVPATPWSSHKDIAAKALRKLGAPQLPTSLTKLERAVKRTHSAYATAERAHGEQPPITGDDDAASGATAEPTDTAAHAA